MELGEGAHIPLEISLKELTGKSATHSKPKNAFPKNEGSPKCFVLYQNWVNDNGETHTYVGFKEQQ